MSGLNDHFASCHDLADSQMENDCPQRPPYRWLLIGVAGTGGKVHTDHAGSSAWNGVVVGRKRWVFFPPGTKSETLLDARDSDERSDYWCRHKYDTVVAAVHAESEYKPIEVIQ